MAKSGSCTACATNCLSCSIAGPGKCDKCLKGYVKLTDTTSCSECLNGCVVCDPSDISTCL